MKKIISYISKIIIFLFLSSNTFAWEKVPVPDYVDKKNKSPWNFFEDFEKQKKGKLKLKKLTINDKGAGLKPFKIKIDPDGNKYLEVTVKHGWNNDPYKKKGKETERAEFQTKIKNTLNKEIFVDDSFFTIVKDNGGVEIHNHLSEFDKDPVLNLGQQKLSLVYYLSVGNQNCSEPGVIKLYEPREDILPTEGMIIVFPAGRYHSASYNGNIDRVIIGLNFYVI